jgi:hypothetical protein
MDVLPTMRATCPARFSHLDLITQITFGGEATNYETPHYTIFSFLSLPHTYSI